MLKDFFKNYCSILRHTPMKDSYMGLNARKPVFGGLQTTKGQTSLRIPAV